MIDHVSELRFAAVEDASVFHVYDDGVLCRSPKTDEKKPRRASRWHLYEEIVEQIEDRRLCNDCERILKEGERKCDIREDIAELAGIENPEYPFSKNDLRQIRLALAVADGVSSS